MQKKLIAMAVAGLVAAPAFAQSNVTVYGVLDGGLAYGKAGDSKFTGLFNGIFSGNRLGFKGSEDLGGGLKAVFTVEQGFRVGDGTVNAGQSDKFFQRQAWVGLEGGFGQVALGRQYSPGYNYSVAYSGAVGAGEWDPQSVLANSIPLASFHPNTDARWDNSVTYKTGNMGGVSAEAIYSFQGVQSDTGVAGAPDRTDDDKMGVGVRYDSGPVGVGLGYHRTKGAEEDLNEIYIGGSYDLGAAKIYASYQTAKRDDNAAAGVAEIDSSVAYIGATVPVGMGTVHVAYGQLSDDAADDNDSRSVSLAYTHNLSKRTNLVFIVNRTTNDDNAARGILVREAGEGSTAVGAGVRHKF